MPRSADLRWNSRIGHEARWPWTMLHYSRCSKPCRRGVEERVAPPPHDLPGIDRRRADRGDRRWPLGTPYGAALNATSPTATLTTHSGRLELRSRAAGRVVLPLPARTPPSGRPGSVRGDHGGLPARCLHRKVDDLVKALGADTGISKSEVSRSAPTSTKRSARSATAPWPRSPTPRLPRRHLLQGRVNRRWCPRRS